jgi:serine/threonine-protein kinase
VKEIVREVGLYALVTEYADGGSLWDLMGGDINDDDRMGLDERTAQEVAQAIVEGLVALHENSIVHRDLKPQNILRCDDPWKIADFGISKLINNPTTGFTFQGAHTAPWAPPEQIDGAPAHPSADVYAFARVMTFVLTGCSHKEANADIAEHWKKLLDPCLDYDPGRRPSASSLQRQLQELTMRPTPIG